MVAVDTLVHNFLHQTGVLCRRGAEHLSGPGCYRADGCADTLLAVADVIAAILDARCRGRDVTLAEIAMQKLEARTKL